MKMKKWKLFAAGALCLFGFQTVKERPAAIHASPTAETYTQSYYKQLDRMSAVFYNAMSNHTQEFMDGATIDLTNEFRELPIEDIQIEGKIQKSLQAANDAYRYDHTETFWLDTSKIYFSYTISDNELKEAKFSPKAGTDNYFISEITSKSEAQDAVDALDASISDIMAAAPGDTVGKLKYFHDWMKDVEYVDDISVPFTFTAYGALVEKKAVCEGYARSMKMLIDKLGLPNALISGLAKTSASGKAEPHMWNYVQLDNKWYMIDTTWDSTGKVDAYFLNGANGIQYTHFEDPSFVNEGYEFRYPVLNDLRYSSASSLPEVTSITSLGDEESDKVAVDGSKTTAVRGPVTLTPELSTALSADYGLTYQISHDKGETWTGSKDNSSFFDMGDKTSLELSNTSDSGMYRFCTMVKPSEDRQYILGDIISCSDPKTVEIDNSAPMVKTFSNSLGNSIIDDQGVYQVSVLKNTYIVTYDEKLFVKEGKEPQIEVIMKNEAGDIRYGAKLDKEMGFDKNDTIVFDFWSDAGSDVSNSDYTITLANLTDQFGKDVPSFNLHIAENAPQGKISASIPNEAVSEPVVILSEDAKENFIFAESRNRVDADDIAFVSTALDVDGTTMNSALSKFGTELKSYLGYDLNMISRGKGIDIIPMDSVSILVPYPKDYNYANYKNNEVNYKVIHFPSGVEGNGEEVSAVPMEHGILISAKSFSPYVVSVFAKTDTQTPNIDEKIDNEVQNDINPPMETSLNSSVDTSDRTSTPLWMLTMGLSLDAMLCLYLFKRFSKN